MCIRDRQNPDSASQDNVFVAMALLHSEILLVSAESRQLYSWSCNDNSSHLPSLVPHPLTEELGLSSERIAMVESSDVRATVVTESGKVATFYDSLLRGMHLTGFFLLLWEGNIHGRIGLLYSEGEGKHVP